MISAKKQRKTIEWERLEISSRKSDTKGTFHAKMGTIKNRNGMDLTEAEDIKRWQGYTEKLYKKHLHDQDNHDDVITHLGPDILECEVKWALGSITTNKGSGGDGIQVKLFQILKDDASKCGKLNSGHRTGKGQFSFQSQRKAMPKNAQLPHNCTHLTH